MQGKAALFVQRTSDTRQLNVLYVIKFSIQKALKKPRTQSRQRQSADNKDSLQCINRPVLKENLNKKMIK